LKEDLGDEINRKGSQCFYRWGTRQGVEKCNGSGKMLTAVKDGRSAGDNGWRKGRCWKKKRGMEKGFVQKRPTEKG
jgi:hypothetical protein